MGAHLRGTKLIIGKKEPGAILSWLPTLFYLANLFRMTGHTGMPFVVMLAGGGLLGLVVFARGDIVRTDIFFFAMIILTITGLLNFIFIGNADIGEIGSDILYMGMMIVMLSFPMTYSQALITFYVSIAVFVMAFVSDAGTSSFLTSSGNYISVLAILSAALYYMTLQMTGRKISVIDIIPALLCFRISIWAKGRGGILCCMALLLLVAFFYIKNSAGEGKKAGLVIIAFLFIIGLFLVMKDINLMDRFLSLGKWSSRGLDNTSREAIWGSYFRKTTESAMYFLLGAPLQEIPIIHALNDNTHNSFFQLHATNGIFAFVIFIILLVRSGLWHLRNKKYLFATVLFVVFLRGMTDKFVFGQYGMPIVMYLILYPFFDEYATERAKRFRLNGIEKTDY